jgi:uncharacterized protein (DUF433 family)
MILVERCKEGTMKTTIRIVDYGRGPQIEGHRLTVLDVFYYLHRGRDWDFIHRALPSLKRDEFDAVVDYVREHYDELAAADRRIEERNQRGMEEQDKRDLRLVDPDAPFEERLKQLKEALHRRMTADSERNGDHAPG